MRFYWPIAKVDAERRMVYGYATTEAEDDQGEIVKREAIAAALDDYMKFANIREMHQPSAVGVAKEAQLDDKGLYLAAKIVDDEAWEKVVEGVYKGFSIGGRVTARDPGDRKVITGLSLTEISVVDRPANPEAVFDCWKRGGDSMTEAAAGDIVIPGDELGPLQRFFARLGLGKGGDAPGDGSKPYGDVEYADPGYQDDQKKRYPLDTEAHIRAAWNYIHKPKNAGKYTDEQLKRIKAKIVAAWKDKIDPEGPPAAESAKAAMVRMKKHLLDVGPVAEIVYRLDWLGEQLAMEAAVEGDDSPASAHVREIVAELCAFLRDLVAEETAELAAGEEADQLAMAAGAKPERSDSMEKRSEADQHLMDLAHAAVHKALGMDGMTAAERGHLVQAKEALKSAGANEHSTVNTADNPEHKAPTTGGADPTGKASGLGLDEMVELVAKRGQGHQHLMDLAHDCTAKLTDGMTCMAGAAKAAARHSQETMDHLHRAHYHLVAAGGKCDAAGAAARKDDDGVAMAAKPEDLAKALGAQLSDALGPLAARLDGLAKDVEAIKQQPLPPATVSIPAGLVAVSKSQDAGGSRVEVGEDELVARLAKMSEEDRTLLLIKAARTRPILPPGLASATQLRAAGQAE